MHPLGHQEILLLFLNLSFLFNKMTNGFSIIPAEGPVLDVMLGEKFWS